MIPLSSLLFSNPCVLPVAAVTGMERFAAPPLVLELDVGSTMALKVNCSTALACDGSDGWYTTSSILQRASLCRAAFPIHLQIRQSPDYFPFLSIRFPFHQPDGPSVFYLLHGNLMAKFCFQSPFSHSGVIPFNSVLAHRTNFCRFIRLSSGIISVSFDGWDPHSQGGSLHHPSQYLWCPVSELFFFNRGDAICSINFIHQFELSMMLPLRFINCDSYAVVDDSTLDEN